MLETLAVILAPALLALARVQDQERSEVLTDLGLTLTLPAAFVDLERFSGAREVHTRWRGKLGRSSLAIFLQVMPGQEYGFGEPVDVTDLVLENWRDERSGGDPRFEFTGFELLPGPFGWAAYGSLGYGPFHGREGLVVGTRYVLGGLLESSGYLLEVRVDPPPAPEEERSLLEFLRRGIRYQGAVRDARWSDGEIRERWQRDAPPSALDELEKPLRTKHFVILTDSSGGKKFAEKMEESYAAIQKTFPFPEVEAARLLPVFLFQVPDEYYEFYAKVTESTREEAERSKGFAYLDFYATWYEAPNDPVHVHEATHQIFENRLHLDGGGSWFQEGVAEYMSTTRNDRNVIARLVKERKHTPLGEFVRIPSLLQSPEEKKEKSGESAAHNHYLQAALLVEFLRESPFGKERFLDWLKAVGRLRHDDSASIERVTQALYGVDLAGLEERWVEYCKKRK